LGKERYDDYHVSGFGTSLKAGLNVTFFKHFYIQGELKGVISICKILERLKVLMTALHKIFLLQDLLLFEVYLKSSLVVNII
jgi:hypothetical protein